MGTPDSREYDRLKGRNFRPYSKGHQVMYTKPIEELKKHPKAGKLAVFEAGFGIGWGLDQMVKAGIFAEGLYIGCEPNADSFNYTSNRHLNTPGVSGLILGPFDRVHLDPDGNRYDVAFCIEVIEHVPAEKHLEFLTNLRKSAPLVYFSTPDIDRVPKEGVRTCADWTNHLWMAGFKDVSVDKSQWTYLYTCRS